MQRVLVIGSGGAGKSRFASRLGAATGLPVVHLDACYWHTSWTPTPKDEWARAVGELAARDAWVMDGNYSGTLDVRIARCDTVVFLDVPRLVCLWRVVRRWLRHLGRTRADMAPGCPERLNWEFVQWIWTYPRERRPGILRRLGALAPGQRAVILRSRREIERFLSDAPDPAA
jgi:adenylate kinase family enzyme